jgi:hypothetical protein
MLIILFKKIHIFRFHISWKITQTCSIQISKVRGFKIFMFLENVSKDPLPFLKGEKPSQWMNIVSNE